MRGKRKIFVSAYACEPGLGSEIGVGWHWVLEMSRRFELWVLTRESNRGSIEPWIEAHPEYAGIHFLYFDLPKWARFWKKGLRGVRTYYNLWQWLTNRIVKRTMQENDIDVFHHLTYGNALWPVSRYGSRQRFIWGPIGGLETIPEEYTRHYDRKSQMIETLRRLAVKFSSRSMAFKRRANRADLILCKTSDTLSLLPEKAKGNAILFTDVATDNNLHSDRVPCGNHHELRCIAVGRLDAWRGFDIAIEAMALAIQTYPDITLTIVGKGMYRQRLEHLVASLGMGEKVNFAGAVSQEEYRQLMQQSDVVLNPSLKEGAVTVSFDAMAMGKPLIAIDTGGYTRYFGEDYSIVIPREGRANTIENFSKAILQLADKSLCATMGERARQASTSFTWEQHGKDICDTIETKLEGSR